MGASGLFDGELHTPRRDMLAVVDGSKLQLDLRHDFLFTTQLRGILAQSGDRTGYEGTFGSCMKAPPLLFGGSSPVVAYLRHSMMVVLPEPL